MRHTLRSLGFLSILLAALLPPAGLGQPAKPLKALFLTGGGYHDYQKLAPFLTNSFGQRVNITFDVDFSLSRLDNKNFADAYDVVVYDVCFDNAADAELDNALNAIRAGKPAVMIHCAVHSFRNSPKVHEWEAGVGMRSKVHDAFGPFQTKKVDAASPILNGFPDDWRTPGDELYQTIDFPKGSHALLSAKSPRDGRVHIVCWTQTFGQGRVFATTLGHDMQTTDDPAYLGLLARGLLWSCDKLEPGGKAAAGFGKQGGDSK
jgi:type 1 glutamine amidotransferase